MSVTDFYKLPEIVGPKLIKHSLRPVLRPDIRLAIVLHFLAHGGCARNNAWMFRIGLSTIYKLIPEVCQVLRTELLKKYVRFPTQREWLEIAEGFHKDWNFPNCLGALDGKHFRIERPPNVGGAFINYKKFNRVFLLAICDSKRRITWFNFGDYGSFSDSSIFLKTDLYEKLDNNSANIRPPRKWPNSNLQTSFVFLSDEIFGLSKNIMKPFARRNNFNMEEKIFNYRLSRARLTVECAFGIMNEKWEMLKKPLRFSLKTCDNVVGAIIGLHNFTTDNDNVPNDFEINGNYNYLTEPMSALYPTIIRNRFKEYFSSQEGSVPWQLKCV